MHVVKACIYRRSCFHHIERIDDQRCGDQQNGFHHFKRIDDQQSDDQRISDKQNGYQYSERIAGNRKTNQRCKTVDWSDGYELDWSDGNGYQVGIIILSFMFFPTKKSSS